jgi:hypothetical protein
LRTARKSLRALQTDFAAQAHNTRQAYEACATLRAEKRDLTEVHQQLQVDLTRAKRIARNECKRNKKCHAKLAVLVEYRIAQQMRDAVVGAAKSSDAYPRGKRGSQAA